MIQALKYDYGFQTTFEEKFHHSYSRIGCTVRVEFHNRRSVFEFGHSSTPVRLLLTPIGNRLDPFPDLEQIQRHQY